MQAARRRGWQQCCRLLHTSGHQQHAYYDARSGLTRFGSSSSGSGGGSRAHIQLGLATLAVGGVVYVTHLEPVPVTGRQHFVLCSAATERRLGDEAYAQVRAQFAGSILAASSPDVQRVQRVSKRILEVLPALGAGKLEHLAHLRNTQWQFTVVRSPQVNAFAVPNGKVVVFTGLLRLFPDDDELAVVLAHEIAHVVARHSAEKVSTGLVSTCIKIALALATGIQGATGALVDVGMNLPFSRRAETEADSIGLQLMARGALRPPPEHPHRADTVCAPPSSKLAMTLDAPPECSAS
jgi:predicted Zn-dependent protease